MVAWALSHRTYAEQRHECATRDFVVHVGAIWRLLSVRSPWRGSEWQER